VHRAKQPFLPMPSRMITQLRLAYPPFTTEAWVPMIETPSGADADLWDGFTPNVMRAMSLVPDEVRNLKARIAPEFVENEGDLTASRSLSRPQMEFISARVSALNECFY
jgi:hypothetical protein